MTTKYYKQRLGEVESDLNMTTSALFDVWCMLRILDEENADRLDLLSVIKCAVARIEVGLGHLENTKNDD